MAGAVGLRIVDPEVVVGMLDACDLEAAAGELGDQALGERRLAGLLPAGDADDGRAAADPCHLLVFAAFASIAPSCSSSCRALALKNGSMPRPQRRASRNGTAPAPRPSV